MSGRVRAGLRLPELSQARKGAVMAETVEPAESAEARIPVAVAPAAPSRVRMPASFVSALAGGALLVGTVVTSDLLVVPLGVMCMAGMSHPSL